MKILKIILIVIVVLAAAFFIGGLLLPKTYSVTRSAVVKASQSVVIAHCSDYNKFLQWNPWHKMEPTAKVEISGSPAQPGHLYKWVGADDKTGTGQMQITKVEDGKLIESKLTFVKPFAGEADNQFAFQPQDEGTQVTWTIHGENRSLVEKWMAIPMNYMLGNQFEDGLKSLKELTEKK